MHFYSGPPMQFLSGVDSPLASSAARITGGLTMKLDASSVAQGKGNTGAPTVPCSISLHEKRPPGFSTRATSCASPSLSAMFIVTANDQTWSKVPSWNGKASAFPCRIETGSARPQRAVSPRHFDEIGREVDRCHPATTFSGEIARRAAEATTEI